VIFSKKILKIPKG